jgi:DNA-binding NarL/FixJ family response regulator
MLFQDPRDPNLTEREWEVFQLLVEEGLQHDEVSKRLGVSVRTAKLHTMHLLRKLGAPDRLKLVVTFWRSRAKLANAKGRRPRRRR